MAESDTSARSTELVLRGRGTAPGRACGPLRRNSFDLPPEDVRGSILVAERAVPEDVGRILASEGTIALTGSLLSHVSLLSREFGKPSVSLGPGCPARLVPPGEGDTLLELRDVVGSPAEPSLLREGDVVTIDGDLGTVALPAGLSRPARVALRRTHEALREFAHAPASEAALGKLLAEAEACGQPAAAHAIDAAILCRIVPPGDPSRTLIRALLSSRALAGAVETIVAEMIGRIADAARDRCRRALDALPAHADAGALDRDVRSLEEALRRDVERLLDLGGAEGALSGLIEPVLSEAVRLRRELGRRIAEEVTAASAIPEGAFRSRLGGLHQLARRARSAGIAGEDLSRLEERLARTVAEEREQHGGSVVLRLDAGAAAHRGLVGGKAAGLMAARDALPAGCSIPRGFVVTSSAYRLHLLGEREERLREAVRDCRDAAALSRRARAIVLSGETLEEVVRAIGAAFESLPRSRLAVRSSATVEDGPTGSLAGLFDSWIGVDGLGDLLQRVRMAWASLWNARALRAMHANGLSPLDASQAVLVQEAVSTRAAGVLFSRDPAGSAGAVLINAAWGLGEAISQGETEGDVYRVRRDTGEVLTRETGRATTYLDLDPSGTGTVELPLPREKAGRPCLGASDLARLAALAAAVEEATGRVQDVEFGIAEDGSILVFQIRRLVQPGMERARS